MKVSAVFAVVSVLTITAVGSAHAVDIHGIDVVNVGRPHCAAPNPAPFATSGTFYPSLRGNENGLTDAYAEWPALAGNPYSALVGSPGSPSSADYRFSKPQQFFIVVDGTPDPSDRIEFFDKGDLLGIVTGGELIKNFWGAQSLNLRFHLPLHRTFDEVRLATEAGFEIANIDSVCR